MTDRCDGAPASPTLGKSRGYALPGAVQHVTVAGPLVFLSTTPDS